MNLGRAANGTGFGSRSVDLMRISDIDSAVVIIILVIFRVLRGACPPSKPLVGDDGLARQYEMRDAGLRGPLKLTQRFPVRNQILNLDNGPRVAFSFFPVFGKFRPRSESRGSNRDQQCPSGVSASRHD